MLQITSIVQNSIHPNLITTGNELSDYAFAGDIHQVCIGNLFQKNTF